MPNITFNDVLELIEIMSDEDQDTLLEITQKRRAARKRDALLKRIQEARAEYARGETRSGTVEELMRELNG